MEPSKEFEVKAACDVLSFMAAAARTAPKGRGIDNIEIVPCCDDAKKKKIVDKMRAIAKEEDRPSFERDANSMASSPAMIVIGVRPNPAGLNCGFCGYPTCEKLKNSGGVCAFNSMDLGIATASAAGVASDFHMDNRLMYSIGRACIDLGYFSSEVKQALGIPLSVTGKNPFFDRR